MMIRLWCENHNMPLQPFDGGPELIADRQEEPKYSTGDVFTTPDGIWAVDLSNVLCPREITAWDIEVDTAVGPGTGYWVVSNICDPNVPDEKRRVGPYLLEVEALEVAKSRPLDECVTSWKVEVVPDVR